MKPLLGGGAVCGRALVAALLLAGGGCRRFSEEDAIRTVRAYDEKLVEAFRSGDGRIMDSITGVEEGRKILGLIGVKRDMGYTLDSTLLDLKVLGVERQGQALLVRTEERWRYVDRRIGTGAPVGPESNDHYLMRYTVAQDERRWVVTRVEFVSAPEVGREVAPPRADLRTFHGLPDQEPRGAPAPGRPDPGRGGASGSAPAAAGGAAPSGSQR